MSERYSIRIALLVPVIISLLTACAAGGKQDTGDSADLAGDETTLPEPQNLTIQSESGLPLAATFYAGPVDNAPGVLLLHQMRTDRAAWENLPEILRGSSATSSGEMLQANTGFAVLVIDYPGHGETGGTFSDEAALRATRDAMAYFQTLPGVDPQRIIIMGASIGADAAVDECRPPCIGAVSLSPGGWLGTDYTEALRDIKQQNEVPVLCLAAERDGRAPDTCQQGQDAGLDDFTVKIYEGSLHGNDLILAVKTVPQPDPVDFLLNWLTLNFLQED